MLALAFAESIQLVPDGTLILHIAIIITMVFILNKVLYKPVIRILEERERQTRGRSKEARETILRIEDSISRYENSLRQARAEGYRLMEKQQAEAIEERREKVALVRKEIDEKVGEEKRAIEDQASSAREIIKEDAKRMAASISAQVLKR